MSNLLVVSAPSGAGKTTLLKLLRERVERVRFSVSHTTRAARRGEVDGSDYHFIDRSEFVRMVAAGEFLEWAEVYGNAYGTHCAEIDRARRDRVDLVLDLDLQGARSVRRVAPEASFVLIVPPSWQALEWRLRQRATDDEKDIARRLGQARSQLEGHDAYDYLVVNDDLETAFAELKSIVTAERLRLASRREALARLLALLAEGA